LILKNKILELYTPQAKYKNIDLEVVFNPETAKTPLFRNWLLQITGNLISNAIKFTHPDGRILVLLELTQNSDQRFLKISVADTGIGMDPAILSGINEGNCSSTTGTAGEKGYGFGLNLVAHLVKLLQGTLSVEANADCGTTFTVVVPQPAIS
jgi:signal transduction histidine kinase